MLFSRNVRFLLAAIQQELSEVPLALLFRRDAVFRKVRARRRIDQGPSGAVRVRWNLAKWLGRPPTRCETSSLTRTAQAMEEAGLLHRWSRVGGHRMTHVVLTDEGQRMAEELQDLLSTGQRWTRRVDKEEQVLASSRRRQSRRASRSRRNGSRA